MERTKGSKYYIVMQICKHKIKRQTEAGIK